MQPSRLHGTGETPALQTETLPNRAVPHARVAMPGPQIRSARMRLQLSLVLALFGGSLASAAARGDTPPGKHEGEAALFLPEKIEWRPGPASLPKGATVAVLEGNPAAEGPFVVRIKMPD